MSYTVLRLSDDAVMSRKTSSSAPCSSYTLGERDWIAGVAQLDERDALYDTSVGDVEAGNDALREHGTSSLAYSAASASGSFTRPS